MYHNVVLSQDCKNDNVEIDSAENKDGDIELWQLSTKSIAYSGQDGGIPPMGVSVSLNAKLLHTTTEEPPMVEDSAENIKLSESYYNKEEEEESDDDMSTHF